MRFRKSLAVAAIAAASVLTLGACAGGDTGTENPPADDTTQFEAGTTMAKLHDAGSITIGTKFDQPLFGLKGLDGNPVGFDVETGKLIAKARSEERRGGNRG